MKRPSKDGIPGPSRRVSRHNPRGRRPRRAQLLHTSENLLLVLSGDENTAGAEDSGSRMNINTRTQATLRRSQRLAIIDNNESNNRRRYYSRQRQGVAASSGHPPRGAPNGIHNNNNSGNRSRRQREEVPTTSGNPSGIDLDILYPRLTIGKNFCGRSDLMYQEVVEFSKFVNRSRDVIIREAGIQCVICLMEFQIGQHVKQLPCRHVFHVPCIVIWLSETVECPLCRRNVREQLKLPPLEDSTSVALHPHQLNVLRLRLIVRDLEGSETTDETTEFSDSDAPTPRESSNLVHLQAPEGSVPQLEQPPLDSNPTSTCRDQRTVTTDERTESSISESRESSNPLGVQESESSEPSRRTQLVLPPLDTIIHHPEESVTNDENTERSSPVELEGAKANVKSRELF